MSPSEQRPDLPLASLRLGVRHSEQHRIVAKVDVLMAVCDQLEAERTTIQSDSPRLLEAVLHEALA